MPPASLPDEDGNLFTGNSKWQWTVTYSTGNNLQPKGKSGKSQAKTFSDRDTHLMESLLSRRDTLFRRNSTIFIKIASGQQYENKKSGPKSLHSSGFYSRMRS
jgi:hypothetical protein